MATVDIKGVVAPNGTVHNLYYTGDKYKVNLPVNGGTPSYGENGQILRTNGDGNTEWAFFGAPTDEQVEDAVSGWLDDHPEATTTVQDSAITRQKLANGVNDLFDGTGFYDEITVATGTYTNGDGNDTTYYLATVPMTDSDGHQIDIYAGFDNNTSPLTYAQENLTTLTTNTSLDLVAGKPAVISNGEIVRESTFDSIASSYPFVVYVGFDANRVPHEYPITTTPSVMINDGILNAAAAYYRLVQDGEALDVSNIGLPSSNLKTNPRMAMFTKSDGSICFLACDGRDSIDEGLTPSELANLMIDLGAVQGWNMDGGGSASMVTCGSKINRNVDDNGITDRGIKVTWNVGSKYSNPATQQAIVKVGVEKQRLIRQILTYLGIATTESSVDPTALGAGEYYIVHAVNIPSATSNNGFCKVLKKKNSQVSRVYWYPYSSHIYYMKWTSDGETWSEWIKLNVNEVWDLGADIPSNANLNSYTAPGKYRVGTSATAGTISNIPTASGGTLFVYQGNNSNVVYQTYITGYAKMYTRRINMGTTPTQYGDWAMYTEVRNLTATVSTDANGIFTFSTSLNTSEILSMRADGYIVLPFKDGTTWKGLLLSTSLQPVASASNVSVTAQYSLQTYINDVS